MFQEKWRVSHQLKKKSICQDIVTNVTFFFIYASETLIKLKNSRYLGKDVDNTLCFFFHFQVPPLMNVTNASPIRHGKTASTKQFQELVNGVIICV